MAHISNLIETDIEGYLRAHEHKSLLRFITCGSVDDGKSTIANLVEKHLLSLGRHTYLLDGDNVRPGLNRDLGFTDTDRVDTPLAVAEARDVKGLYRKARRGELKNFTGIDSPYEPPEKPEIYLDTTRTKPEHSAGTIVEHLRDAGMLSHT